MPVSGAERVTGHRAGGWRRRGRQPPGRRPSHGEPPWRTSALCSFLPQWAVPHLPSDRHGHRPNSGTPSSQDPLEPRPRVTVLGRRQSPLDMNDRANELWLDVQNQAAHGDALQNARLGGLQPRGVGRLEAQRCAPRHDHLLDDEKGRVVECRHHRAGGPGPV